MNRKRIIKFGLTACLVLSGSLFLSSGASAQSPQTPSQAPGFQPALHLPDRAVWTIDFVYDAERRERELTGKPSKPESNDSKEDPLKGRLLPKRQTITKDGSTYREVTEWTNGKVTEKWVLGDYQIVELPNGGELVRVGLAGKSVYKSDYSQGEFGELAWIPRGQFKGTRKLGERDFLEISLPPKRLASPNLDGPGEGEEVQAFPLTALFFKDTRRPYLLDDGEVMKIYSYPAAAVESLVVPARFDQEFKAWQAQIDKRKLKTSRPETAK